MKFVKGLVILGFACLLGECLLECPIGFNKVKNECKDRDECEENPCGNNSRCTNTNGSYYCQCNPGFKNYRGNATFTQHDGQCQVANMCENANICDPNANCKNINGSYDCTCRDGYINTSNSSKPAHCEDIDECKDAGSSQYQICGQRGRCENVNGSYWCRCPEGFTNYQNPRMPCSALNCNDFSANSNFKKSLEGLADILLMMRNSCLALTDPSAAAGVGNVNGEALLQKVSNATQVILSPGSMHNSEGVSGLLTTVENSILFIGPQLKRNHTRLRTTAIDAEIAVHKGETPPSGPVHLANEYALIDTDWTTAAGTGPYPGFALVALLSYKNLGGFMNDFFGGLKGHDKDGEDPTFQVSSKVVTVVVSNPSTQKLSDSVNITLRHLEDSAESEEVRYICAYWNERGGWSTDGCYQQHSNATHTLCTCEHLSSFAVLMALYPMEHDFGLTLVTKIGLSISLLCLILCILTFKFCRSIQGTRTTIHLHLCVCLFMGDLIFLVGISQTKPVGGCRFVAALLHYFFLAVFTWMLLEGVQLYRMVVLVFNATIQPLYLYITGYGIPLAIVVLSAIIRPYGYGTNQHCWLSLEDGLIWSFFGPVCFIILMNVFFFLVTVWKLAQKFTTLNPDLSKLRKIKAFTFTAIAQMCILGLMWVFGAFLFHKDAIVSAYIFTILNSLQGALVFIMHCLLSKQVRDEYASFCSCICPPQKKKYSDFSSTNPSSSQSHGSRSGQITGESQL